MPTGTGAQFTRNLPNTEFSINPQYFAALTSKTIFNPGNQILPTFGNYFEVQLLQVGIVTKLRLLVNGTITTTGAGLGATPIVPTAKWPWGLLDRVTISGNGQNDFIACDGWDLKVRQQIQNRGLIDGWSFFPTDTTLAPFNLASAAYPFRLQYEVPIAMDDITLIGSLYAQSEATNLTFRVAIPALADLFTVTAGTTIAIAATMAIEETIFEVPYDPQHKNVLVIPDLSVLHGLISNNAAIGAQTTVDTPLYRIQGQLERLIWRQQDAQASTTFWPSASYTNAQLIYGSNQTPYTFQPIDHLRVRNMIDIRNVLPDGIFTIDAVAENAARDQILLEGVTNLRLHTQYPAAGGPAATASIHFVQETLFS